MRSISPEGAKLIARSPGRTPGHSAALIFVLAAVIGAACAAPAAHAGPDRTCNLSARQQDPPGGTSAYDLAVERRGTSCATAIRVMLAFHRCRTEARVGCPRRVLGGWRCSGQKTTTGAGSFGASFTCMRGRGRVESTYLQNVPACFGAAARDPRLRCFSRARSVVPRLGDPDPEEIWQCEPDPAANACVSGVPAEDATRHVALVGDSHTAHWRAALNLVARIDGWRVYSHFVGGCFYSTAARLFSEGCGEFQRNTARWLLRHPEVSTVFVTSNADTPVGVTPGEIMSEVKVAGFREAFEALPKTVKHLIVLRDTPRSSEATMTCAGNAIRAGTLRLAPLCPLARSFAIRPDLAVTAVRRLHSTRYRYVDLTRFMCGSASCYPIVGGTLVNGDQWGHLNMTFMRTLAPYLLRSIRALEAAW